MSETQNFDSKISSLVIKPSGPVAPVFNIQATWLLVGSAHVPVEEL